MAHIITFMDDTLNAGAHHSFLNAQWETKRPLSVHPQTRVVYAHPAVPGGSSDAAPVRMDRVRALRAAIADGSYAVSAGDLADKILHSMLQK